MKRTPEEERIFRALAQIKTPEADLSAALRRAEEPRRIRPVRPLAAAAVLCALLTIGAAAVGFSGAWRYFVHSLPQNAVQTVGASQTSGDYTLTVEEAVLAEKHGADYLGVGAVFPTGSKDDADDVSYETLKAICGAVSIPVVAIGGITQENVAKLAGSGICGVAVISAIYAAKNIQQASADLKAATEKMLHD